MDAVLLIAVWVFMYAACYGIYRFMDRQQRRGQR